MQDQPVISGIEASSATQGVLGVGSVITFTLKAGSPLMVTGAPTLVLSDGGRATFDPAASTIDSLVFRNTVVFGQHTGNLQVVALLLNDGAIVGRDNVPLAPTTGQA